MIYVTSTCLLWNACLREEMIKKTSRDAEELEVLLLEQWDGVTDALSENGLEVGAKGRVRIATRQDRLSDVGDGAAWVAENGCPLLNLLIKVLWEESGIAVIWV